MTRVNKYDTYKDSGIEWIGEIPQEWNTKKFKYCCNVYTGNSINDDEKDEYTLNENAIPYIATKDIDVDTNLINYDNGLYIPLGNEKFKVAPANSSLLCIEGGSAGRKICYTNQDVCFVNKLCCFKTNELSNSKYLYYVLQSDMFLTDFNLKMTGLIGGVSQSAIKNIALSSPKLEEQQAIADYLDKKCGEIDKVVEAEKSVIEKLKEYKQSIITEVVTKGLDKSVPLKDSGIEWIGKIPEHWEVGKIKHKFHLSSDINDDENATLLSLFTHIGVKPRAEMEDKGNKAQTVLGYSLVKKDDIIVNKLLAWMGAIGLSSYNGATSPDYDIYRLRNIQDDCPMFYHYLFRSCNFKDECYKYGRGIMLMRLRTYPEEFLNIYIPIILQDEQENIVNYLNQKCSEIDKAIADKEQLIEKLTEYKKSLIYECVTGKRKVVA